MRAALQDISNGFELLQPRALSCADGELVQSSFDLLLKWLHPDREEAGRRYELIRRKLITVFTSRGCRNPEELADETINRVMAKVDRIVGTYDGDPALYFYGVARNVCREYRKFRKVPELAPPADSETSDSIEAELNCLDECMERLLPKNRDLLLEYYQEDKQAKIDHRKTIAERYGLDMNALRIRVHRIRSVVAECTTACVERCGTAS